MPKTKFNTPVIGVYVDGEDIGLIAYSLHRLGLVTLDCGRYEIKAMVRQQL